MYKFITIRHDINTQCHGNYKEMKKINYNLEIEIFRNSTQKKIGCPEGFFLKVWVSKKAPRPLLAKTMLNNGGKYQIDIMKLENAKRIQDRPRIYM